MFGWGLSQTLGSQTFVSKLSTFPQQVQLGCVCIFPKVGILDRDRPCFQQGNVISISVANMALTYVKQPNVMIIR